MKENKYGLYPEWSISGKEFSPNELINKYPNLLIKNPRERTEIAKVGRFPGKEIGYGSCWVSVADKVVYKLHWLLDFILEHQNGIRELGVEDETIWIMWYGRQGNMELSPEELNKLAETGNQLNMIYYQISEDETSA